MNTVELIHAACRKWLTVPDQSSMGISDVQDLLNGINVAQGEVWRALPVHYRKQPLSLDFYPPEQGIITVNGFGSRDISGVFFPGVMNYLAYQGNPLFYNGEVMVYQNPEGEEQDMPYANKGGGNVLLFNGESVVENPRPFCSVQIEGDSQVNVFDATQLLHPYLGTATGSVPARLWNDKKLLPYNIERIVTPVVDRQSNRYYCNVNSHRFTSSKAYDRNYSIVRRLYMGVMRTLVELTPEHDLLAILSCEALVSPVHLTLGSSIRPLFLPYDEEIGSYIVDTAGQNLRNHPLFRPDRSADDIMAAASAAYRQYSLLSPATSSQHRTVGTPYGW